VNYFPPEGDRKRKKRKRRAFTFLISPPEGERKEGYGPSCKKKRRGKGTKGGSIRRTVL